MASVVFISIGYRGTNGWPGMIMVSMPAGMTKKQFEEQGLATDYWPYEDEPERTIRLLHECEFVAFFEVEAGRNTRLDCMHDCNAEIPPGMKAYYSYADFIASKAAVNEGW